jgi:hypothetical protein
MKRPFEMLNSPEAVAVHGAASKPLSREQKTALVLIARQAYDARKAKGDELPGFDAWRGEQAIAACGSRISEAGNADFSAIKARFLSYLPDARAFVAAVRSETEERRQALYKLRQDCQTRGLDFPAYPASIARQQYKRDLEQCTPKQIWRLVFTVRNRRKPQAIEVEANPF